MVCCQLCHSMADPRHAMVFMACRLRKLAALQWPCMMLDMQVLRWHALCKCARCLSAWRRAGCAALHATPHALQTHC